MGDAPEVPAPEAQTEILDLAGHSLGWVDFYWDDYGVAGEVDGKVKYVKDPFETWWRERHRHERLGDTGLVIVRWGRAELESMAPLVARLEASFRRGDRPGSDRRWVPVFTNRFAPRITA